MKSVESVHDQIRGTKSIIAATVSAGIKRVLWVGGTRP